MKCLECNKEVKQLNYKHLKKCCNLSPKEYKNKYNVELFDEATKKKCSFPLEKNGRWKGGISSLKYYCKQCNNERDKRSKSKLCVKCAFKGELNPFYNKKHSEKSRIKMIESAEKRDKLTYIYNNFEIIKEQVKKFLYD